MTIHLSITAIFQHLIFVFLLAIAPAWDYYDTSRLKRDPSSPAKLRYYKVLCSWLWIAALLAIAVVGWSSLFTIRVESQEISWLSNLWGRYIVLMLISVFLAVVLLPGVIGLWKNLTKQPRKYSSADALTQMMGFFLPNTRRERRWFAFVCLTAGCCEELLFRGFLLRYLHTSPWHLNLTLALLISAIIFGLQHLYLGSSGFFSSFVGGWIFGLLYLLSGSLLPPMILHALLDLRMLVILRPAEE